VDETDEFESEPESPVEPVSERVRIYGAEVAGSVAGAKRGAHDASDDADGDGSASLEERYLGFSSPEGEYRPEAHRISSGQETTHWASQGDVSRYMPGEPSGSVPVLPHWTDPPTGQVPAVVSRHDDDDRSEPWAQGGPSWREHDHEWEDGGFEPSLLADDETRLGALDDVPLSERRPWEFGDLSSSGESEEASTGPARRPRWSEAGDDDEAAADAWWEDEDSSTKSFWDDDSGDEAAFGFDSGSGRGVTARVETVLPGELDRDDGDRAETTFVASISSSPLRTNPPSRRPGAGGGRRHRRRRVPRTTEREGGGAGRNVPVAIATGVGFALLALACFELGSVATLALSTVVVTLAAAECYAALRRAGRRPATLLGLVATVGVMVSVYAKGIAALPLVLVLVAMTSMIWYLTGAEKGSPLEGITTTLFGFVWVGMLGAFAALMLAPSQYPHRHGVAFVFGAVVATIAEDVGALALGGWLGRHPLAPRVSPRKTWEGFIGGAVLAVVASAAITGQVHPWTPGKAAVLGLVVAVVAPLGDLCESLVKRDLGLKDMGSLLPGHGGVLDRVDALLFVLPATYYLVRVLHLG